MKYHPFTYGHTHTYIYIYMYVCIFMYISVIDSFKLRKASGEPGGTPGCQRRGGASLVEMTRDEAGWESRGRDADKGIRTDQLMGLR